MQEPEDSPTVLVHCPECAKALDVTGAGPYAKFECPHCAAFIRVRTVMGQYQIVGVLGEGGMSQVFRALDRNLGREVALKVLHQSLSRDESLTAMFEREAKLTASIVHANVVKVFSVGQDHGYFFIAMELLQATSLEQLIANKGALSEVEVLGIALDVAHGLKAAYEEQLIHRDIKPGNLLVTGDGTTKLVDFGLALQQGGEDVSGDLWATPFYVPPEKLEGTPDTFLGDIYSLGATLYHALAGKPPFDANTSSLEELRTIKRQAVDLKSVAPGLTRATVRLVEAMMAYRPEDRIPSYDELIARIEEVRRKQFGIESPSRVRKSKRRVRLMAVVALVPVLALFGLVQVLRRDKLPPEGELGIDAGERVIAAGDQTVAEQFLAGRASLVEGKLREAEGAFGALAVNEEAPASTRIWSHFLIGLSRLFQGETELSRESFDKVCALTPEPEASGLEAIAFLQRASSPLAEALPVLATDAVFAPDSVEALGLLSAGLKNWQHGEFDSGAALLEAFVASRPPSDQLWLENLKKRVEPFLADQRLVQSLPNPTASSSEAELAEQEVALRSGAEEVRTLGAAPRLVKRRLERVAAIRKLAVAAPVETPEPLPSEEPRPEPPATASPEETAEIERLRTVVASLSPRYEGLQFAVAGESLRAEEIATPLGTALRDELLRAGERAGSYLTSLAAGLSARPFEGIVRRREGRDLEASVTAENAETFFVDLGFGPNEVPVGEFSPSWLLEAGATLLPPPTPETAGLWEEWIYFGLFTGQGSSVEAAVEDLSAADPGFAQRWELLGRLR